LKIQYRSIIEIKGVSAICSIVETLLCVALHDSLAAVAYVRRLLQIRADLLDVLLAFAVAAGFASPAS
jgi:hypothetical protein